MDFGGWKKLRWFNVVPEYGDNRDLPEQERLSCDIRRMSPLEIGDQQGWNQGDTMLQWRDHQLTELAVDDEDRAALLTCPVGVLVQWRQFAENTRRWRNFTVDGEAITDPRQVFLACSGNALFAEINAYIVGASQLTGEKLKNFVGRVSGTDQDTDVPLAATDASLINANTPLESVVPSS